MNIEELKTQIRKLRDEAVQDEVDHSYQNRLLASVRAEGKSYAYRTVLELLETLS